MSAAQVVMETSLGTFRLELDAARAPRTVANFLSYVEEHFYVGTLFHRVISFFVIQGGGFEPGMRQKQTRAPIENEAPNGLSNVRGTIALARAADPDSGAAQFDINVVDNSRHLDGKVCVFGKVVEGMDVVDRIKAVPTKYRSANKDVPVQDVVIRSVRYRPVAVDPAWLAWNGGTVPKMAEAIAREGAFDRLLILADALEEAGCADPEVLGHLRGGLGHTRGCWVVDWVLDLGRPPGAERGPRLERPL